MPVVDYATLSPLWLSFPHKGELPPALLTTKVISSDTRAKGFFTPVVLTACVSKFMFNESVKSVKEVLAYPFSRLHFNKLFNG